MNYSNKGGHILKQKRVTDEQIIGILKKGESGVSVKDILRKHGIAESACYRRKSNFGGMKLNDVKGLRNLEQENNHLKTMVVESVC